MVKNVLVEAGLITINLNDYNFLPANVYLLDNYYKGYFRLKQSNEIEVPFIGLNSEKFPIQINELGLLDQTFKNHSQTKQLIEDNMDKKENDLIENNLTKYYKQNALIIRRKISPDIAEILKINKDKYRAYIISQEFVYGYESIIIILY